jgi:hypothetical protein
MPEPKVRPVVPEPQRVRRIDGSFGWIDHRLLRDGHLEGLTLTDLAVYVFLVLAADRNGVSFYRKDVISRKLDIGWGDFAEAKRRLIERRLIAFRPYSPVEVDGFYQVLPLSAGGAA